MMLNQWIWSSIITRYVSQRDAHRIVLGCTQHSKSLSPNDGHADGDSGEALESMDMR